MRPLERHSAGTKLRARQGIHCRWCRKFQGQKCQSGFETQRGEAIDVDPQCRRPDPRFEAECSGRSGPCSLEGAEY